MTNEEFFTLGNSSVIALSLVLIVVFLMIIVYKLDKQNKKRIL